MTTKVAMAFQRRATKVAHDLKGLDYQSRCEKLCLTALQE